MIIYVLNIPSEKEVDIEHTLFRPIFGQYLMLLRRGVPIDDDLLSYMEVKLRT